MGGTAPLTLVHHRPVVELDELRVLLDTAGSALLVDQAIANDIGLATIEVVDEGGQVFTVLEPPGFELLDTDGVPTFGFDDTRELGMAAHGIDVVIPARVLQRHRLVLDPVDGVATIDGDGEPRGLRVPADVDPTTGLVRVTVLVAGEVLTLLLDTGVSCSLAADRVMQRWSAAGWPASAASVGPGNMAGLRVEARTPMVRVPEVEVGQFTLPGVAFAWRGDGDIARIPGAPVEGSLGGSALRAFRIEIDPDHGSVWFEQRAPMAPVDEGDTDQVGVTLVLGDDGDWEVGATVSGLAPAVQAGDRLLTVDGASCEGRALGDVLTLLSGAVGARHHLVVRRGDSTVEADAPVVRVL